MTPESNPPQSRFGRDLVRATAVLASALLVVTVGSAFGVGRNASAAGTPAGAVQVLAPPGSPTAGQPLTSGVSVDSFALAPPVGAACSGDSVAGFRVQSYMVPATVDPGTLTFNAQGPIPQAFGADLRLPMISATGTPFVNVTTALTTGLLINLPVFSFNTLRSLGGATVVPTGIYNIGYACTLGVASPTQQEKFWNVQLFIDADPNDVPNGLRWTTDLAPPPPPTTVPVTTVPVTTVPVTTVPVTTVPVTTVPVTTVPGTTTSTTTTTIPPTTTTTTTTPGATTTTVEDDDEDDNEDEPPEKECTHRRHERHKHGRGDEVCRAVPQNQQSNHPNSSSRMRLWRS